MGQILSQILCIALVHIVTVKTIEVQHAWCVGAGGDDIESTIAVKVSNFEPVNAAFTVVSV